MSVKISTTLAIITLWLMINVNGQTNCVLIGSKRYAGGEAHLCIVEEGNKMGICTSEKMRFPIIDAAHHYRCTRGSQTVDAYRTSKDGAHVWATEKSPSVVVAANEFATRIGCIGFYTALVVNPNLDATRIEALFHKLTNCHISEVYQSKAKERAKAGISLVADILGAIPTPHTIVAGLVIKALLTADSMAPDPKENDYIRFLAIHRTIADIKVLCGTLDGAQVKTCLKKQADEEISADGLYQFELTGCTGSKFTKADSYLILQADGGKATRTKADAGFGSPLVEFCKGNKPDFLYNNVEVKKGKNFCITGMDADWGSDTQIAAKTCVIAKKKRNTIDFGGGMRLTFQLNK